jgi:hypothetical protein
MIAEALAGEVIAHNGKNVKALAYLFVQQVSFREPFLRC